MLAHLFGAVVGTTHTHLERWRVRGKVIDRVLAHLFGAAAVGHTTHAHAP